MKESKKKEDLEVVIPGESISEILDNLNGAVNDLRMIAPYVKEHSMEMFRVSKSLSSIGTQLTYFKWRAKPTDPDKKLYPSIGNRISASDLVGAIKQSGYSYRQISEEMGISYTTLYWWVRKGTTESNFAKVCKAIENLKKKHLLGKDSKKHNLPVKTQDNIDRSETIRTLMKEQEVTTKDIAEHLDVSTQSVSGKLSFMTLETFELFNKVIFEIAHSRKTIEKTEESEASDDKPEKNENNEEVKVLIWDVDRHSNIENFNHLVEKEVPKGIKNAQLKASLDEWFKYKDSRKPKSSNHYQLESIRKLVRKAFKMANKYGTPKITNLIDDCIANNYQGIIWDRLNYR